MKQNSTSLTRRSFLAGVSASVGAALVIPLRFETGLAQILAEELGADWSSIVVGMPKQPLADYRIHFIGQPHKQSKCPMLFDSGRRRPCHARGWPLLRIQRLQVADQALRTADSAKEYRSGMISRGDHHSA